MCGIVEYVIMALGKYRGVFQDVGLKPTFLHSNIKETQIVYKVSRIK